MRGLSPQEANRLVVGARGEINVTAGLYKGRYATNIQEVNEDLVGLSYPMMKGVLLPAYRAMDFDLVIDDGNALYLYPMSVVKVDVSTGLPLLWARIAGDVDRIQRRNFLRVSCFWDVSIFHLDREVAAPGSESWFVVKVVDISQGGFRFKVKWSGTFNENDDLLAYFILNQSYYYLLCRTTRIIHTVQGWDIGAKFDAVPSGVEKALLDYVRKQELSGRG